MSAPADNGSDGTTVFDSLNDPFVGDFVRFAGSDEVVRGEVVKGVESERGTVVHVRKSDGSVAKLPWKLVETVDGTGRRICSACGYPSSLTYRCTSCGHDLAGDGATAGREGGDV